MVHENVKVLIVPSSDDEKSYENCQTIGEAIKIHEKRKDSSSIHEFETEAESDAFLQGYKAGVGSLGNGTYFTNL